MQISIKAWDSSWIIAAIAKQWQNELSRIGHEVAIDYHGADRTSQIHIHFIADDTRPIDGRLNIVFVTHLDFYWKILNCIRLYRKGASFVCMSKHTECVLRKFIPRAEIFTITPQSLHFGSVPIPGKITFGLFFRLYDDNRKDRRAIEALVNTVAENSSKAKLLIYGSGFDSILSGKPTNSITYIPIVPGQFNIKSYRSYLEMCDYVVHFGRDEGAISILDAATLSIPVLATDQGYHRDITLPTGSLLLDTSDAITTGLVAIAANALGTAILLMALGRRSMVLVRRVWHFWKSPQNAWLMMLGFGPIVMTLSLGIAGYVKVPPNFLIPTVYILPLLVLIAIGPALTPGRVRAVMMAAALFMVFALAVSPIVAYASVALRVDERAQISPHVATAATEFWHEEVDAPLRIAAGTEAFSLALPFYSADGPAEFTHFNVQQAPWITPERIAREGMVSVCAATDTACLEQAKRYETAETKRRRRVFQKSFWGVRGTPIEVIIITVPPRNM